MSDEPYPETFHEYVKFCRLSIDMGMRQFAEHINYLPSDFCRINNGKMNPLAIKRENLERIANGLKLKKGSVAWNYFFQLAGHDEK